jgi:protein-tyrosine phosphatase
MTGYVDLHCHYLPGVDDGVPDAAQGRALCHALREIGYATVVATPHIRTAMFDNRAPELREVYERFAADTADDTAMPELGLAAEHFCDDVFWDLFERRETLPYPGGHAALVEFPADRLPLGLSDRFFRMQVRGVRPVIAHPERYAPLFRKTAPIGPLLDAGALAQLDVMSLVGRYGRTPQRAAERMLQEEVYHLASSDCHRVEHVEIVADAIARLQELVGEDEAQMLLGDNPRALLEGRLEP